MKKFNLFIIGAQKTGSSYLHFLLLNQNEISGPREEIDSFDLPNGKLNFPLQNTPYRLCKRANLLANLDAANRIHKYNKDAKILVVLRNPVSRLESSIRHYMRLGLLEFKPLDFYGAKILNDNWSELNKPLQLAVQFSLYGKYLLEWIKIFGCQQVLIIKENEIKSKECLKHMLEGFLCLKSPLVFKNISNAYSKTIPNNYNLYKLSNRSAKFFWKRQGECKIKRRRPIFLSRTVNYVLLRTFIFCFRAEDVKGKKLLAFSPEFRSSLFVIFKEDQRLLSTLVKS
ncbi:MAG: sulfotransferase domain-containing protein [Opitutales bacterium]